MFVEGKEGPIFLPVDDPLVKMACRQWAGNRETLALYLQQGRNAVLIGQDHETGDYIILQPKEKANMDKAVYWKLRQANEKLQAAYFDMDDAPKAMRDEIKIMSKRLAELVNEVNALVI